jgi:glycolate oxidase
LIEVEGLREAVEENALQIESLCQENRARQVRRAKSAEERDLFWKGRKNAFGALGRISPSYYVQDGVIPRTRLPEMLEFIGQIGTQYGVKIGNIFHAGDGNLHPIILFDLRDADESRRVHEAAQQILAKCIEMGGSITGEHGVGIEKINLMPLLFSADDLDMMRKVKGVFNSEGLFNPGKIFPTGKLCGELRIGAGVGGVL